MSRSLAGFICLATVAACKFPPLPEIDEDAANGGSDGAVQPDAGLRSVTVTVDPLVGSGVVVANVGGIDCGSMCTADVLDGVTITFMANPANGAAFVGWRSDAANCGTERTCMLTVAGRSLDVGARFATIGQAAWIRQVGGAGSDSITNIASDGSGNVVIAAKVFGQITFAGDAHVNTDGFDMLLAKISPAGDVMWHRFFGGTADVVPTALAVRASTGDIVVGGTFSATVSLGGSSPLMLPGGDIEDHFVAQFRPDGSLAWQRHIRVSDNDDMDLVAIAIHPTGDPIVVGDFHTSVDLGDGPLLSAENEIYVARLSSAGDSIVWKKKIGAAGGYAHATAVAVSASGAVVVGGYFAGPCQLGGATINPSGTYDGFLAGYDGDAGTFRWQRQLGGSGTSFDRITALVAHPTFVTMYAAVSLTAVTGETMTFGGSPITGSGGTGAEIIVGAISDQNSFLWSRRYGTSGSETPNGLSVRPDATLVLTGGYGADIAFGATTLMNGGGSDGFLVRLTQSDGSATFAARMSGPGSESLGPVASTSSAVIAAGVFDAQTNVFGAAVTPVAGSDGMAAATILPP